MAERNEDAPPPRADLDDLFAIVDRLPFLGTLKKELTQLRELLYDRRTPRLLVIGARGSGRTSLANSLLALPAMPLGESAAAPHDAWIRIDATGRHLDWLEVDSEPIEGTRLVTLRRALDESAPDLALLVIRADAPDDDAARAKAALATIHGVLDDAKVARPKVLGVVTHVDRIAKPDTGEGKVRFTTEDLARIDQATQALKNALEQGATERARRPVPVVGGGELGPPDAPLRWNVAEVAHAIHDELPEATKV
jgi:hypothetical protein